MAMDWRALVWFTIIFLVTTYRMIVLQDVIEQAQGSSSQDNDTIHALESSTFGDFQPLEHSWLNISGFSNHTMSAWQLLPKVQDYSRLQLQRALGEGTERTIAEASMSSTRPLYRNVTSITTGTWTRAFTDFAMPALNLSLYSPKIDGPVIKGFERNLTAMEGTMTLGIEELASETDDTRDSRVNISAVRFMKATIDIEASSLRGESWSAPLQGVHFPNIGHALLSTHGDR